MRDVANKVMCVLLPVLLWCVLSDYINSILLLLIFFAYFIFLTRDGITIVSVFILCPLLGLLKEVTGSGIPGTVVSFALIILIQRNKIIEIFMLVNRRMVSYIILLLVFFVVSFLLTGRTGNSSHKIIMLLLNTIVYITGLLVIVKCSPETIKSIVPVFLLYGLILLRLPVDFFGYSSPEGLFDFSFYRESTILNKNLGLPYVAYHATGIAGVYTVAFLLSVKHDMWKWLDYILLFTSAWLILLSGARQAIVGFLLVIICWLCIRSGRIHFRSIVFILLILPIVILILQNIDAPQIQQIFEDKGSTDKNLNRNYDYPISIISNNYLTGIGFGNYYNPSSMEVYPHNLFLEIACEMGLLGLCFFIVTTVYFSIGSHFAIVKKLKNGCFCFVLWLPYFIRSMISADLSENVMVFLSYSIFFFSTYKSHDKRRQLKIEEQYGKRTEILQPF